MTNRKTRRRKLYKNFKENCKQGCTIRNKQGVNKWGDNRTKKNKKRYVKGGESSTKYIVAYENPLVNSGYKKGLHKYITRGYDKVKMTLEELLKNMDENMALVREGRKLGLIKPTTYYMRRTNNPEPEIK
jgi:hypothetical protein